MRNPTSSIRTGFDYQDMWGLHLCAEWMINPGMYLWIRFETIPEEVTDIHFFLDDIVLMDQNRRYHLYQIKHRDNPARDRWSWDSLLEQKKNAAGKLKDSLLQKWYKSYTKGGLRDKVGYAAFVTNGLPEEEIQRFTVGHKIDFSALKSGLPEVYARIVDQLQNEDQLQAFFADFDFRFNEKGVDELEVHTREVLYRGLKATETGVTNLLQEIHRECRKPRTNELDLGQIRRWCKFDEPKPLDQSFRVPADFQLFDKASHMTLLADLLNPKGGVKVVYGKPGSGKSTYLAQLDKVLRKKSIATVRHHYQLSPDEVNPQSRLVADRVIEAMKAQFKEHSEELGELANQNSANVPLRDFIARMAEHVQSRGKAFVLIVDGLDYVIRYATPRDLENLIQQVCFPQPGVWIVLGTQEVAKEHLPQRVMDECPEDSWVDIRGLDRTAVGRIVEKNLVGLNLPCDPKLAGRLSDKIFEITQGNPLHLRYTLRQLKNRVGSRSVTGFDCNDLLPYGGDIARYYDSLWRQLPGISKTLAIIVSAMGCRLREAQLFELAASFERNPTELSGAYGSVSHLLTAGRRGICVYHNSFQKYVLEQPEFRQQERSIKQGIREWLEGCDYEGLKWAELRRIAYDLGDPDPILAIDGPWLVDAICSLRESLQVTSQLELGAKAAFENRQFGKAFKLASLRDYYRNGLEYSEDTYERVWEESAKARSYDASELDLTTLSARQIHIVTRQAEKQGRSDVVGEAIMILRERHREGSTVPQRGDIGSRLPELPSCSIRTIALQRQHSVSRVLRYIKQFAERGWSEPLLALYTSALLATGQHVKVQKLAESALAPAERRAVLNECAMHDLELREQRFLNLVAKQEHFCPSHFCLLYLALNTVQVTSIPALPVYGEFPLSVPEHETGKREDRAKVFSENFVLGLLYGLVGRESDIHAWIERAEPRWALQIMSQLLESALVIARQIRQHGSISYQEVFDRLSCVTPLGWPDQRDLYELQVCLRTSLASILDVIRSVKYNMGDRVEMGEEDVRKCVSSAYFTRKDLLQLLTGLDRPLLSATAYKEFVCEETAALKKLITPFPERAEHYADLARLSEIHSDLARQQEFIRLAARNLLGYGDHKDMYLGGVIQSLAVCGRVGSMKGAELARIIAPVVENVREYTDGDETRYFPKDLAEVLVDIDEGLLRKYYYHKAETEELFLAQDIFGFLLRSLQFTEAEETLLATTALDQNAFKELQSLSRTNNGAQRALDLIQDYFGEIEYADEVKQPTPYTSERPALDYASIKPENLNQTVAAFEHKWDQHRFLVAWSTYWLDSGDDVKERVYHALAHLVQDEFIQDVDGSLLDVLYPLAYEFDADTAFEYLCWAQANDNGWHQYWTDRSKAERRWDFVKQHYPDRYLDFFERSIVRSGKRYGAGGSYFIPIPRGIEFLSLLGDLRAVEEIVEASADFAWFLMADLELPACRWIDMPEVDTMDILVQRLVWPSALVREKAASGLARLLRSSPHKEEVLERLLSWIENQRLETVVAIGLLPLLKAAEESDGTVHHVDVERVTRRLPVRSVVIDRLLEELGRLMGASVNLVACKMPISPVPSSYSPNKFFGKHIKGFLAPIYLTRAQEIAQRWWGPFVAQWAYTSSQMIENSGLEEKLGDARDFRGGWFSPVIAGMSSKLSEVYRSAFLRSLQHCCDQKLMPAAYCLQYAYATLPVDLSFWKIIPGRAPQWWPRLSPGDPSHEVVGLRQVAYQRGVRQIMDQSGEFMIAAAEGCVEPAEGWTEGPYDTSVTMVAFGYRVIGANMPEAKEVADEILYGPVMMLSPEAPFPFNFLESGEHHVQVGTSEVRLGDLLVHALVARIRDFPIGLWQWFRDYPSTPFGFGIELREGLDVFLDDRSWGYVMNGEVVVRSGDWLEGLKERYEKDLGIPHGSYFAVRASFLASFLQSRGLRLGYICKTVHKYRRSRYEDVQEIEDYELFGIIPIIT